MDSIFLQLEDGDRDTFLQRLMQSLGSTYICLWSYLPQKNCLLSMAGFYNEEISQPSSSAGTLGRRLFDEYRQFLFSVENDNVPGLAFKNGVHFMELKEYELQNLASAEAQLQFYQEAKIKNAIFMGCNAGEIELGFSNDPQVNLEAEMKNWFPEEFSQQAQLRELPLPADQNRPSSSSSSLRSLSMDSSDCCPFSFNVPKAPLICAPREGQIEQTIRPISTSSMSPLHQSIEGFTQVRNPQFPPPEAENEVITKAILAVLSSSSPSSSSSPQQLSSQNVPTNYPLSQKSSAFGRFRLADSASTLGSRGVITKQNMLKKSISFLRALSFMRNQEKMQGSRPTTTQMHHMISERKRREKLNERFEELRSLLPPGTKKDKATVLKNTTEYLTSLKAQVEELTQKNQNLEAQLSHTKGLSDQEVMSTVRSNERIHVQITNIAESTSEARIIDLQVLVGGQINSMDLVICVMEFLKQVKNVGLMSVEADTTVVESNTINRVVLRLKIEGGEWDESAFQEAVRRVVADLVQ